MEKNQFKLLEILEMEHKRISNELHDTTVQTLTMLIHKTELCKQLMDRDSVATKLELQMMKEALHKTIQELRCIIYNLRPMSVDDLGLIDTIERFVSQKEFEDHQMNISFGVIGKELEELNSIITISFLRIVAELYNNAKNHAQCKNFDILIHFYEDRIALQVTDDGIGFSSNELSFSGKNFGLSIIKERVSLLSGTMEIDTEKDKGTVIFIEVPIEQGENDVI